MENTGRPSLRGYASPPPSESEESSSSPSDDDDDRSRQVAKPIASSSSCPPASSTPSKSARTSSLASRPHAPAPASSSASASALNSAAAPREIASETFTTLVQSDSLSRQLELLGTDSSARNWRALQSILIAFAGNYVSTELSSMRLRNLEAKHLEVMMEIAPKFMAALSGVPLSSRFTAECLTRNSLSLRKPPSYKHARIKGASILRRHGEIKRAHNHLFASIFTSLLDKRGDSYHLRSGRDIHQTLDETRVVWHSRGQEQEDDSGDENPKREKADEKEEKEPEAVDMTEKDREAVKDVRSWQVHALEEKVAALKGWFPKDWLAFCSFGLPAQLVGSPLYCVSWIRESLAGPRKDTKRKKNTGRHERRERDRADRARKARKKDDDSDGPGSEEATAAEEKDAEVVEKIGVLINKVSTLIPSAPAASSSNERAPEESPVQSKKLEELQVKMKLLQQGVDLGVPAAKEKMEALMKNALKDGLFD